MASKLIISMRYGLRITADSYPILEPPINVAWNTYEQILFKYYIYKNTHQQEYSPPVFPYYIFHFPLDTISHSSSGGFCFLRDTGKIKKGSWDRKNKKITSSTRYRSFEKHFNYELPWEKTELYQRKLDQLSEKKRFNSKCVTKDGLDRKFKQFDQIYNELQNEGYKSQIDIAKEKRRRSYLGCGGEGLLPASQSTLVRHEVAVDFARDGQPLLNEGRHRICMAKLLGLESIPVRVVVRHHDWQNVRKQVAQFLQNQQFESIESARKAIKQHVPVIDETILGVEHPDIHIIIKNHIKA